MEPIVHAAIEEICARGANGLSLSSLWPSLNHLLSDADVKRAIWSNLITVPGMRFLTSNTELHKSDPKLQSLEACQLLDIKIVANESLVDCFLGLYDNNNPAEPQRQVLDRLAMARGNGITQSKLSKELGIRGNKFFYVVKSLESRGLVVRQPTIVKDTSEISSSVHTHLIHLYRYATPLRSHQRLEITVDDDGLESEFDALVKDFLPAMKAVCDKLEQADGKVLVEADIKVHLGYRGSAAHKRWRKICERLQKAGLVEVFEAEVDDDSAKTKKKRKRKTPISCLRLLKSFSPKIFEPKTLESGHDETNDTEQLTSVRRSQSEKLMELPIEHQIFDMVDAEGSKGLLVFELCRRLGISNKKYHKCIDDMFKSLRLHQLPENHKKGIAYRCWTPRNFEPPLSKTPEDIYQENENISPFEHPTSLEKISETVPVVCSQEVGGCECSDTAGDCSLVEVADSNGTLVETSACTLQKPMKIQSRQRYRSVTSSQREQRILDRLKKEKFMLKCEIQQWIENLEDKYTKLDSKTVTRCLESLQKEGHCSISSVCVPCHTNYGSFRTVSVIQHSSVSRSVGDLSDEIKERMRSFDMHSRQSSHKKTEQSVPTLKSIQRLAQSPSTDGCNMKLEPHVGSVFPKMVRARLLHHILWGYVNDLSETNHVLKNPHNTCKLFALEEAVKASPVELFIQVVGSSHKHEDIRDRHKTGALLSDLSLDERKQIMSTQAVGSLSRLIDILRRLKLIRMVANEHVVDETKGQHAVLTHALELKPYVEEPQFINPVCMESGSPDLRPHFRHDFILMTKEALEEYWQTLEYCYAAANQESALRAFPGSVVRELFSSKSWTRKVMTAEHKHIVKNDQFAKLTFKACEQIANDLNLSLAQVLLVHHCQETPLVKSRNPLSLKKRKISSGTMPSKRLKADRTIVQECEEDHHTETVEEHRVSEPLGGVERSTSRNAKRKRLKDNFKGTASKTEDCTREEMSSCRVASDHRLPARLVKQWEEGLNVVREAHTSVAVANAIELFKIVFLSTSTSTEVPHLLAETLRCYSEHDLFSAFEYLRQKKIMVKNRGSHPYGLSQNFLQGLVLSEFPTDTGKRANKLAGWINEREKDLMDGVVSLSADLQCGDIFHLVALLSCGEMTISPLLSDDTEIDSKNKKQKLLSQESEMCSRRGKGFPGIQVLLRRTTISRPDAVELFKDDDIHSLISSVTNRFDIDCMEEAPDFGSIATEAVAHGESQWEVMANFTNRVLRLSDEEQQNWIPPSLFQSITMAVQEAGDQGLSMLQVSELVCMPGKSVAEDIIDVLHAFGMAYKVNGYDSFHVVDPLYRSKYFLNSKAFHQEYEYSEARRPGELVENVNEVHKVTILNLSVNANKLSDAIDQGDEMGQCEENEHIDSSSSGLQPLVPWMNGDGSVNVIVYKGLTRRLLGIVMQSPGILEDDVISQMDVINPQSCKKLMELLMLDNHIFVRKMRQTTSFGPPSLLRSLCGSQVRNHKFVFREHIFANPMSTCLL